MKDDYKIIIDTREQQPLFKIGKEAMRATLKTGDYSIEGQEDNIAIERKSLGDLFGTLGKGHSRFKKELERVQSLKYFAIVVEGTNSDVEKKNFEGSYHSKMKGYVINKILFTIHIKYGIPIFYCDGRVECKRVVKSLLDSYYNIYVKEKK